MRLAIMAAAVAAAACTSGPPPLRQVPIELQPAVEASLVMQSWRVDEDGNLEWSVRCGAVAVARHVAITAAHCVSKLPIGAMVSVITRYQWEHETDSYTDAAIVAFDHGRDLAWLATDRPLTAIASRPPAADDTQVLLVRRFEPSAAYSPTIGRLEIPIRYGDSGSGVFATDGRLVGLVVKCDTDSDGCDPRGGGTYTPVGVQ